MIFVATYDLVFFQIIPIAISLLFYINHLNKKITVPVLYTVPTIVIVILDRAPNETI